MRLWIRVGAGGAVVGLAWWLLAGGWWEMAMLVIVAAGLGAVAARPKRPPGYKPIYYSKRDFTI